MHREDACDAKESELSGPSSHHRLTGNPFLKTMALNVAWVCLRTQERLIPQAIKRPPQWSVRLARQSAADG